MWPALTKLAARFAELLRDVVARGRAAGIIVLAATQKPSIDMVPFRPSVTCSGSGGHCGVPLGMPATPCWDRVGVPGLLGRRHRPGPTGGRAAPPRGGHSGAAPDLPACRCRCGCHRRSGLPAASGRWGRRLEVGSHDGRRPPCQYGVGPDSRRRGAERRLCPGFEPRSRSERFSAQGENCGWCSHPIRLVGSRA